MDVDCIILLTFSLYLKIFILRGIKILNYLHPRTKEMNHNIIYQVIIVAWQCFLSYLRFSLKF